MSRMSTKTAYWEKLQDPRWQKKRLEMLQRADFHCECCFDGESKLNLHHRYYIKDRDPWDYPDWAYLVMCDECHKFEHDEPSEHADWETLTGAVLGSVVDFDPIRCDVLRLILSLSAMGFTPKDFAQLLGASLLAEWKRINPGEKPPTGWFE